MSKESRDDAKAMLDAKMTTTSEYHEAMSLSLIAEQGERVESRKVRSRNALLRTLKRNNSKMHVAWLMRHYYNL